MRPAQPCNLATLRHPPEGALWRVSDATVAVDEQHRLFSDAYYGAFSNLTDPIDRLIGSKPERIGMQIIALPTASLAR
jgi:hypothetical protein